ncbi:hypothetical protein [Haloimpatiens lingqiaonensis]|uniref:hypothetical protein n=1 Tax=Haloimpatiens lingqiaonensis TaxID=1380675 RepID=UPI0010FF3A46|nr:hypothetical protein [Haloimpatiens lingqiaonensis]
MDSDKLYNLLDKIYTELQSQNKSIDNADCKFDGIDKELQNLNKKIDEVICIKKEMLTILDESKKSF